MRLILCTLTPFLPGIDAHELGQLPLLQGRGRIFLCDRVPELVEKVSEALDLMWVLRKATRRYRLVRLFLIQKIVPMETAIPAGRRNRMVDHTSVPVCTRNDLRDEPLVTCKEFEQLLHVCRLTDVRIVGNNDHANFHGARNGHGCRELEVLSPRRVFEEALERIDSPRKPEETAVSKGIEDKACTLDAVFFDTERPLVGCFKGELCKRFQLLHQVNDEHVMLAEFDQAAKYILQCRKMPVYFTLNVFVAFLWINFLADAVSQRHQVCTGVCRDIHLLPHIAEMLRQTSDRLGAPLLFSAPPPAVSSP